MRLRSSSVLLIPGCPAYGASWVSRINSCRRSTSSGTMIRPPASKAKPLTEGLSVSEIMKGATRGGYGSLNRSRERNSGDSKDIERMKREGG